MRLLAAFLGALLLLPIAVSAQTDFPTRRVTLIVPYPAGGPADALARELGQALAKRWNQVVIVDNRPGANGGIGVQSLVRSESSGHTVLLHGSSMLQTAAMNKNLPYDPFKDVVAVTQIGHQPNALAVPVSSPHADINSLARAIRVAPAANFGSYGAGSTSHIYGELFKLHSQSSARHVAYKGETFMLPDLMTGRLDYSVVSMTAAISREKDKSLRILGIVGGQRNAFLPNVPTFQESGIEGFDMVGWFGLFAPVGTPAPVLEKIASDMRAVVHSPEMKDVLARMAITPSGSTPAEAARLMRVDYTKWEALIRRTGVTVE